VPRRNSLVHSVRNASGVLTWNAAIINRFPCHQYANAPMPEWMILDHPFNMDWVMFR
jgi:hypothetical protein